MIASSRAGCLALLVAACSWWRGAVRDQARGRAHLLTVVLVLLTACVHPVQSSHRPHDVQGPKPASALGDSPAPAATSADLVPVQVTKDDNPEQAAVATEPEQTTVEAAPEPLPFQLMLADTAPLSPKSVARRYGNLTSGACLKVLRTSKGSFKRVGPQKGIATPVRVIGEVENVRFRVPGEKSKFGILDCRLALTLVEFARFLAARNVTEVVVDNFYRVNARLPSARSKRSQHAYGLAIDLRAFHLADGRVWDIERDWGASIDTEPCGPNATLVSPTENTVGLRTLTCELFQAQLFSHHLTPSHDAAHRNHLHLDIKRGAERTVIR